MFLAAKEYHLACLFVLSDVLGSLEEVEALVAGLRISVGLSRDGRATAFVGIEVLSDELFAFEAGDFVLLFIWDEDCQKVSEKRIRFE